MKNTQSRVLESAIFAYIFKTQMLNAINTNDYSDIVESDVIDACFKCHRAYIRNINKALEKRLLVSFAVRCLCYLVNLKCEQEIRDRYLKFANVVDNQLWRSNDNDIYLPFYNPLLSN